MTLTPRQDRLVRELARTPGVPVHWSILADAIGIGATSSGQVPVQSTIQTIRRRFGRDIILAAPNGTHAGYYLPRDWKIR